MADILAASGGVNVREVKADDLTAGANLELIKNITAAKPKPDPKQHLVNNPGKLAFRKHQITWLAYKVIFGPLFDYIIRQSSFSSCDFPSFYFSRFLLGPRAGIRVARAVGRIETESITQSAEIRILKSYQSFISPSYWLIVLPVNTRAFDPLNCVIIDPFLWHGSFVRAKHIGN